MRALFWWQSAAHRDTGADAWKKQESFNSGVDCSSARSPNLVNKSGPKANLARSELPNSTDYKKNEADIGALKPWIGARKLQSVVCNPFGYEMAEAHFVKNDRPSE